MAIVGLHYEIIKVTEDIKSKPNFKEVAVFKGKRKTYGLIYVLAV
jgi:hypothetical protein